jgi:hypothetical protein
MRSLRGASLWSEDACMNRARCGGKSMNTDSDDFTSFRRKTAQQSGRSQIKLACICSKS